MNLPFIALSESRRRSVAKALTWRFVATIDTFVTSYLVTRNFAWAGAIAGVEVATKVFIYYLHERAWAFASWGRRPAS